MSTHTADAIDKSGSLAFFNGAAHMMRADPEHLELATGGQDLAISLPAVLHVLDH